MHPCLPCVTSIISLPLQFYISQGWFLGMIKIALLRDNDLQIREPNATVHFAILHECQWGRLVIWTKIVKDWKLNHLQQMPMLSHPCHLSISNVMDQFRNFEHFKSQQACQLLQPIFNTNSQLQEWQCRVHLKSVESMSNSTASSLPQTASWSRMWWLEHSWFDQSFDRAADPHPENVIQNRPIHNQQFLLVGLKLTRGCVRYDQGEWRRSEK